MNTEQTKTPESLCADEIYYDEGCPMCRDLAAHFVRENAPPETRFIPLQTEGVGTSLGATHAQLMDLMHVRAADGRVMKGADGIVYLFSRRWWGRPLAPLFNLPGAMPSARFLYGFLARNRLRVSAILIRMPYWLPLAWLVTAAILTASIPSFGLIEFLFLLAPMVLVPSIVELHPARRGERDFSIVEASYFLAAALPTAVSFALPRGIPAAALTLPWAVVVSLRMARWLREIPVFLNPRSSQWASRCAEAAADAFMMVGVGGLSTSRLGYPTLGFSEEIILLTAVHFHFSGFVTLNLALMVWRRRSAENGHAASQLARSGIVGVILSVPLIAIGFFISVTLKLVGVAVLLLAILAISMLLASVALTQPALRSRFALFLSALSPIGGMALSMIYVTGEFSGRELVSIPVMAATHGILNGVGFCLCGLLGLLGCEVAVEKTS